MAEKPETEREIANLAYRAAKPNKNVPNAASSDYVSYS